MAPIIVTKIDAARRQLEVAVLLYFNDRDPLAIHTLAALPSALRGMPTLLPIHGEARRAII